MSAWCDCCLFCVGRKLLLFVGAWSLSLCVAYCVLFGCLLLAACWLLFECCSKCAFVCGLLLAARSSRLLVSFRVGVVWRMRDACNVLFVVYRTLCVVCSVSFAL